MFKINNERFPKKELNTLLRVNSKWNHQECTSLIEDLSTQGSHEWTDTEQGRNEIGFYLETKQR
tara:strand:- start:254 stop:445 length:192 start_codon:yes stop_codon:yes gene_type:complete